MRYFKIVFYFLLSSFILGCNHLEEGNIVGKHYEPMNQQTIIMPMVISTGKTTTTMMIPYWVTDNEDWVLHIKGVHKGDTIIEKVYVSKQCYLSANNGDSWMKNNECSFSDDNNHKGRRD